MSRKHRAVQREVLPDPLYQDVVITKFINGLMVGGKKSVVEKIFYGAMKIIEERTNDGALKIFKKAMSNIKPAVEVKSRRIGGGHLSGASRSATVPASISGHSLDP